MPGLSDMEDVSLDFARVVLYTYANLVQNIIAGFTGELCFNNPERLFWSTKWLGKARTGTTEAEGLAASFCFAGVCLFCCGVSTSMYAKLFNVSLVLHLSKLTSFPRHQNRETIHLLLWNPAQTLGTELSCDVLPQRKIHILGDLWTLEIQRKIHFVLSY